MKVKVNEGVKNEGVVTKYDVQLTAGYSLPPLKAFKGIPSMRPFQFLISLPTEGEERTGTSHSNDIDVDFFWIHAQ